MVFFRKILWIAPILLVGLAGQAFAIQRVAPKIGVLEFRGGYGTPQGNYDGIVGVDFVFGADEIIEFDAEDVYDNGFTAGIGYGQVVGGHWLLSLSLDYARNKIKNPIERETGDYLYTISFVEDPTYNQYDLTLHGGYLSNDLAHSIWSLNFGLSAAAGISSLTSPGYETETQGNFALGLDFGLDLKIWTAADKRSFMTLSSINNWNFLSTGARASQLQIGGGIKYFFKP